MVAMICMKALLKLSSLVSLMVEVNTVMLSRYSYLENYFIFHCNVICQDFLNHHWLRM